MEKNKVTFLKRKFTSLFCFRRSILSGLTFTLFNTFFLPTEKLPLNEFTVNLSLSIEHCNFLKIAKKKS